MSAETLELARKVAVGERGILLRADSDGRNRYVRWETLDTDAEMWSVYRDGRLLGVVVRHAKVGEGWSAAAVSGRTFVYGRPSRYSAGSFLAAVAGMGTMEDEDDGGDAA